MAHSWIFIFSVIRFEKLFSIKSEIPKEWKQAIVTTVFNKGKSTDVSNYTGLFL